MAHVEKYTAAVTGHMLAHYDRTHSSSTSLIDESRTVLNHNLAGIDQPLPQLDFLHKRLGEIKVMKRADVNVMCDWIVTAPKELTPEELPLFFNETYKFLNARYGKENVISAYVHMDETTPHIHYAFVPVVIDKKKGIPKLSAKERITRKDLKTFHTDLSAVMTKTFGRDIGIVNESTDLGNNTISQLRQASAELEEFHVEPVQEVPKAVKLFLGKENVVISRSGLDKVNQAAFDSALIMKNAENTIKKQKINVIKQIKTMNAPSSALQMQILVLLSLYSLPAPRLRICLLMQKRKLLIMRRHSMIKSPNGRLFGIPNRINLISSASILTAVPMLLISVRSI